MRDFDSRSWTGANTMYLSSYLINYKLILPDNNNMGCLKLSILTKFQYTCITLAFNAGSWWGSISQKCLIRSTLLRPTLKNCWFAVLLPTHKNWPYPNFYFDHSGDCFFVVFFCKKPFSHYNLFIINFIFSCFEILYLYGQRFGPYTVYSKRKSISDSAKKKKKKKKKKMTYLPTYSEIDG